MAKFVSKNSNYMVVLRPGKEGNRALGTHAISGLYVKFQSGVVDVKEEEIIELLREHPGCGSDFTEIKDDEVDPFLDTRAEIEPQHVTSEIKFGHVVSRKGSPIKPKMTPQVKELIKNEALKMLPSLLKENPEILKNMILGLAKEMKESPEIVNNAPKIETQDKVSEQDKDTLVTAPKPLESIPENALSESTETKDTTSKPKVTPEKKVTTEAKSK